MSAPSSVPLWVPIAAAMLGAIAAGIFKIVNDILDRRRERASILVALTSEVDAIREVIEASGIIEKLKSVAEGTTNWSDVKCEQLEANHFTVFDALASKLGVLGEKQSRDVVRFYSRARNFSEMVNAERAIRTSPPASVAAGRRLTEDLQNLLLLGQRVSAYAYKERYLTPGERRMVASIFGTAIDISRVTIKHKKYWLFQPTNLFMSPNGHLYVNPSSDIWSDDYSREHWSRQGMLIHELAHVWQSQRKGKWYLPLMRHPFCRYGYQYKPGKPLESYGIEQQAEIIRHAFLRKHRHPAEDAPTWDQLKPLVRFGA